MNPMLIFLGLLLLGTFSLSFALLRMLLQRKANLEARIAQVTGGPIESESLDLKARINDAVSKTDRGSGIARDLARADLKLTAGEFVLLKIIAALGMGVVCAWLGTQFVGVASVPALLGGAITGAVIGSFFPNLYVGMRSKRRIKAFNEQLADTIAMLSSSIRSGYSLLQAMELVSRESAPPVSTEFKRIVQEVGLGLSTDAALANLYRRVPSDDLDLMITAVNIQHEVGGNLAQILETIAHTIRERVRIKGEITTLTAQGRISAYVITGMPVALAVMLTTINPGYMAPIFTFGLPPNAWCCMPVTAGAMIIMGYFAIMKIIKIDI
jgi:tight adherence protein B